MKEDLERQGWRMNLQQFAEEADTEQPEGTEKPSTEGSARTYTAEELMQLVQSETDKRVTQALSKQKKEYEKKMSLSGLDEKERALAEKDQRISELQETLREAVIKSNRMELVKTLAARDLPTELADMIDVGDDLKEAQKRIDTLDKAFRKSVQAEVDKRLSRGAAPGMTSHGGGSTMTVDEILKIPDVMKRQEAIRENIDLFRKG